MIEKSASHRRKEVRSFYHFADCAALANALLTASLFDSEEALFVAAEVWLRRGLF